MAKKPQTPLTEFGDSREEQERLVFKNPSHYNVVLCADGVSQRQILTYRTYIEALAVALYTERSLLYVVSKTGAHFNIPQNEFEKYLNLYNDLTGQKLKMPFIPKVSYERR